MMRILLTTLFFAVTVTLTGACSGDPAHDGPAPVDENHDQPDADLSEEDAEDVEPDAPLPVPAHLRIELTPVRIAHPTGTEVHPSATVYAANGDVISGATVEWTLFPAPNAVPTATGRYELLTEGPLTFEACAVFASPSLPSICDAITILVDDGPPAIELYSPAPGAELGGDGSTAIAVRGRVTDGRDELYVHVNGVEVALDEEGEFAYDLEPRFGVNPIEIVASDGVYPAGARKRLDVIWASNYLETSPQKNGVAFDDGIVLRLGQPFFDDGHPPMELSDGVLRTEDLADILYLVLSHLDLSQEIPNPVVDSSAFFLEVDRIDIVDPFIVIDVTDDGLDLFIQLSNVEAHTGGFIELGDRTLDLAGHIEAALSIFAQIAIEKSSPDSPIAIELERFDFAVEGARAHFASLEANAIFDLAESVLRTNLEALLIDTINTSFVDALPELLVGLFDSIEQAIASESFDVDLGLGEPFTLALNGHIAALTTGYRNGLEAHIAIDLSADRDALYPSSPGVALMEPLSKEPPFFAQSPIQIGLRLGLINGILHTLWNAGMLELDISSVIPGAAAALIRDGALSGKLPPILAPPFGGEDHDLLLQLGQLELHLEFAQQTDVFGANIVVGIDLVVDDSSIGIAIADEPILEIWLIESTANAPVLTENSLRQLVLTQLWPELSTSLGEGLFFNLPIPDLASLTSFSPAFEAFTLELTTPRPLAVREGFVLVEAALEGSLPPAP